MNENEFLALVALLEDLRKIVGFAIDEARIDIIKDDLLEIEHRLSEAIKVYRDKADAARPAAPEHGLGCVHLGPANGTRPSGID
jgi:hypothetical protein